MIEELTKTVSAKLAEAQVPIIQIDGRIKRLFSIHQKLKRQKIDLDQVYDFVALRIVTQLGQGLLRARSASSTRRGRRCRAASRTSSRCRARTATSRCTRRSSASAASRSRCRSAPRRCTGSPRRASPRTGSTRKAGIGADRDEQYFVWLRQLLEWQQEVRDPQEFLQNLKIELYPEEVYIFTPKGEVKALPRDATPVDFAYAIHTDVGHQCVGARVNGKMVPLRTRLRNGDIVEIVTAPGHKPSRDWLNFVVTSRARNKIKHYIHAEEKARSLELGTKAVRQGGAAVTAST